MGSNHRPADLTLLSLCIMNAINTSLDYTNSTGMTALYSKHSRKLSMYTRSIHEPHPSKCT